MSHRSPRRGSEQPCSGKVVTITDNSPVLQKEVWDCVPLSAAGVQSSQRPPLSPPDHLVIVPLLKPLQLWRCGGDTDALSDYSELRERVHNTYGAFISAITRCPHFWPPSDKTGGISASRQKPLINCEAMQFRCSPNSKLCPSHIWISMTTDHLVLLKVRECEYTFAVSVFTLHSWSKQPKQANTQGVEG